MRSWPRVRRAPSATLAVLLAASTLVGACGSSASAPAPSATPAATATAEAAAPTATVAPRAPAGRRLAFRATDGVRLRGRLVPGPTRRAPGVVLVHESDGGPDQFAHLVRDLHAAGFATLAYTSRPMPDRIDEVKASRDVAGAVAVLRDDDRVDPTRLAVVGSSAGASAATYYAFQRPPRGVRAIVGLSPADFGEAPPASRQPRDVLLIADEVDRPAADFVADGHPGVTVRAAPVSGHGVTLLPDQRVHDWVLDWLGDRLDG